MKEGEKVSCSNFFPEPIVPVKLGFWGKVEFSRVFNPQLLLTGGFQISS